MTASPSRRAFATLLASLAFAGVAHADGLQSLEAFLKGMKTGRADFTQTVTSPAKNGEAPRVKTSSGTFAFARPGKFRFDYKKPFPQVIVADGKTLWLHDLDLNQVTQRPQAQALGTTPAGILASGGDIGALKADFDLASAPDADGLQWATATPKAKDGQLQSVKVGFKGSELAMLDIVDSFGQRSRLAFSRFESNPALPAGAFDFKPPAGADVVKQ